MSNHKTKEMKRSITFLSAFLLVILLAAPFAASANRYEKRVNKKIEQANYCDFGHECTTVNFGCPFSCASLINANEEDEIHDLIYELIDEGKIRECERKCNPATDMYSRNVVCKMQKCTIPDSEMMVDLVPCIPLRQVLSEEVESNNFCNKDSDCSKKNNLIRCPFSCDTSISSYLGYNDSLKSVITGYYEKCGECPESCEQEGKAKCVENKCTLQ